MGNTACCAQAAGEEIENVISKACASDHFMEQSGGSSGHTEPPDGGGEKVKSQAADPRVAALRLELAEFAVQCLGPGGGGSSRYSSSDMGVAYLGDCRVILVDAACESAHAWKYEFPELELTISAGASTEGLYGLATPVVRGDDMTLPILLATVSRALDYNCLIRDLERLVVRTSCGPLLVLLSWLDAVSRFSFKFKGIGASLCEAMVGRYLCQEQLLDVARESLKPVAAKYCPEFGSEADLLALAANVAVRALGGPFVPTRFGRGERGDQRAQRKVKHHFRGQGAWTDSCSAASNTSSARFMRHLSTASTTASEVGDTAQFLRDVFHPEGFTNKDVVALAWACSLGAGAADATRCGPGLFQELLQQERFESEYDSDLAEGFVSNLCLLTDQHFRVHVQRFASDWQAFLKAFKKAWLKLQESGFSHLRDSL